VPKKRNGFIEGLRRKQQAATAGRGTPPAPKDPAQMTDRELEAELQETRRGIRRLQERAVEAGRQELGGGGGGSRHPIFSKKRRASWK
jgi:hypothetical protein